MCREPQKRSEIDTEIGIGIETKVEIEIEIEIEIGIEIEIQTYRQASGDDLVGIRRRKQPFRMRV